MMIPRIHFLVFKNIPSFFDDVRTTELYPLEADSHCWEAPHSFYLALNYHISVPKIAIKKSSTDKILLILS
uniref:Uncharacterized protein n=1 Tax=Caenorhabditis tropicalis TaxID=1561998 RepID=A0A1I7T289_9PELO